jgi:hypothetical protein
VSTNSRINIVFFPELAAFRNEVHQANDDITRPSMRPPPTLYDSCSDDDNSTPFLQIRTIRL